MTLLGAINSGTNMNTEEAAPILSGEDGVTGQSTTSATLEDITGLTFDLVTTVTGRIFAWMSVGNSTTGGSPATGGWAISINSVDGTEIQRYLSGSNDAGSVSCQGHSASLSPGTYTVKGRHRRVSGSATVNTDVADLHAIFVAA